MRQHGIGAVLQRAQEGDCLLAVRLRPILVDQNCAELVIGDVFQHRAQIGESRRVGLVTQRKGLQPGIDLARLQQLPTRRSAAHRLDLEVAQLQPGRLGDVAEQECRPVMHRQHADGGALEVRQRLDRGLGDDEMRQALGVAGDQAQRAAPIGFGDDAFRARDGELEMPAA